MMLDDYESLAKTFLPKKSCNTITGGGSDENYRKEKYSILNVNPVWGRERKNIPY